MRRTEWEEDAALGGLRSLCDSKGELYDRCIFTQSPMSSEPPRLGPSAKPHRRSASTWTFSGQTTHKKRAWSAKISSPRCYLSASTHKHSMLWTHLSIRSHLHHTSDRTDSDQLHTSHTEPLPTPTDLSDTPKNTNHPLTFLPTVCPPHASREDCNPTSLRTAGGHIPIFHTYGKVETREAPPTSETSFGTAWFGNVFK